MKRFKCKECGYIHIGDEAPDVCPVCGYDKSIFVKMDQVEEGENIAYAMIEELDVTSIKILRQLIDDTSRMAAVASAMAKRALMENNLDLEKYFNALALELLDQASIYMIYSGEFLEVTSSANRPELEKKLQNEMIKIDKFIEAISDMDLEEVVDVLEANKKKIGALMI
ncbi:rubredoxin-like domain-containing protein [Peptostreptococcus stomatis]|uniref:rubredoxin-like domain-containing protein n=1 Tax=Peptostreptococcus stomatis TaxID=341694 RepID=UPI003F9F5216